MTFKHHATRVVAALLVAGAFAGCDAAQDPTPTKLDGTSSQEFEQDDLDRASSASDDVIAYCAGIVSEAQRLGCESHVTDEELPADFLEERSYNEYLAEDSR